MNSQCRGSSFAHTLAAKCHSTPRLDTLVSMARPSRVLADVGCDHAYLSILLIQSGAAERVIASDVSDGPLAKAAHNIARFGVSDRIELRKGDGLLPLQSGEADCIVLAGMGGNVMADILQDALATARAARRLLLQPMSASAHLRRFLYENGFSITREVLSREGRRYYSVLQAQPRPTPSFCEFDCYFSPALFSENRGLLHEYLKKRSRELRSIAAGLERSRTRGTQATHYRHLVNELEIQINSNVQGEL